MTWDLGQLAVFAGTAGLLSALLTQAFSLFGGWWSARRRSAHLALRLAVLFETYGAKCGMTITDLETHLSGAEEGEICFAPAFPELPDSSDAWEHLNGQLAHRVLAFSYLVSDQGESARGFYDVTGDEDTRGTMLQTLDLGLKAFIIGKDLRYAYGLPQFVELENTVGWMSRAAEALRKKIQKIEEERRQRQAERMAKTAARS